MVKIYSDDPLVHYKNSEIAPERTRAEIDGILAEWAVKDTYWRWNPGQNDVFVQFKIEEKINDLPSSVVVKVVCPIVWDREKPKCRPPRTEQVNWRISMRAMWWFIKTHLEMAFVMQSEKTVAFLPWITSSDGQHTLKDTILSRLSEIQDLPVLPEPSPEQVEKILTIPKEETP
jgi:hypothetical protein